MVCWGVIFMQKDVQNLRSWLHEIQNISSDPKGSLMPPPNQSPLPPTFFVIKQFCLVLNFISMDSYSFVVWPLSLCPWDLPILLPSSLLLLLFFFSLMVGPTSVLYSLSPSLFFLYLSFPSSLSHPLCLACGTWKFPSQGSNLHHSSDLSHCSDTRSLTHWATRELPLYRHYFSRPLHIPTSAF